MPSVAVGERYPGFPAALPEGVTYSFDRGHHRVFVVFDRPDPKEVKALKSKRVDYALYVQGRVIVLLLQVEGLMGWSGCPYYCHLEAALPELPPDGGKAVCQVVLLDTRAIVRGIRVQTWSEDFTRAVHAAIREQAAQPADVRAYDAELVALSARLDEDLAREAHARCRGGE